MSDTLHEQSHALAGAVLGAMFAAGVAAQLLTAAWPVTREFEVGMGAMVIGLATAVLAARGVSPKVTLLGFATAVSLGIAASAIRITAGTSARVTEPPAPGDNAYDLNNERRAA